MGLHSINDSGWIDDDCGPEGYITEERAEEIFVGALQAMREMLARFVEQGGDSTTAASIRANWKPSWGKDPSRPDAVVDGCWDL